MSAMKNRDRTQSVLFPTHIPNDAPARPRAGTGLDDWDVVSFAERIVSQAGTASAAAAPAGDPDLDPGFEPERHDALSAWPDEKKIALRKALRAAPWHETRFQLRTVSDALSGREMATWLQRMNFVSCEEDAIEVGTAMFDRNYIYPMRKTYASRGFAAVDNLFYILSKDRHEKVSLIAAVRGIQAMTSLRDVAHAPAGDAALS